MLWVWFTRNVEQKEIAISHRSVLCSLYLSAEMGTSIFYEERKRTEGKTFKLRGSTYMQLIIKPRNGRVAKGYDVPEN
jgi:hypothetical protein